MKYGTKVIFTSLILTAGVLTSTVYFGKNVITNIENSNYWDEVVLGGVVEIADSDIGELVEDDIGEELEENSEDILEEQKDKGGNEETTDREEPQISEKDSINNENSETKNNNTNQEIGSLNNQPTDQSTSEQEHNTPPNEEHSSSSALNSTYGVEGGEDILGGEQPLITYGGTISYGEETYTATLTGDNIIMNNFSYKTITVGDYVIMDRNLGATEPWIYDDEWIVKYTTPIASYGYYYQWGNNYGFSPNTQTSSPKSALVYSSQMPSKYSNSEWITANPWHTPRSSNNYNKDLWGNVTNTAIARQGPCPYGWHIPTVTERDNIYEARNGASNKTKIQGDSAKNFAYDLKFPPAGHRYYSDLSIQGLGDNGNYWSSTSTIGASYFFVFAVGSIGTTKYTSSHSNGFTVRCIQSFPTQTLIFHTNQGTVTPSSVTVEKGTTTPAPEWTNANADSVEWYEDESFATPFDFTTEINADYNLYAKWTCKEGYATDDNGKTCRRITSVIYGTEEYTTELDGDRLDTFTYKTLTVGDYILMDRNLGATNRWNLNRSDEYNDTYGYYYQWGNNYGFLPQNTTNEDLGPIVVDDEYIPSKYVSSEWNTYRPRSSQDNLRGDETDTQIARQGPCPNGWHVPTKDDWSNIIKLWCLAEKGSISCGDGKDFAEDLLLPPASGIFGGEGLTYSALGELGLYWSSTTAGSNYEEGAFDLYFNSDTIIPYNPYPRSMGHPVRCVQNYTTQTITFHVNGGTMDKTTMEIKKGQTAVEPQSPTKENEVFVGWYTDESLKNEFDFSTPVASNLDLYAKYGEGGVEYLKDEGMIKVYAGDKEYYIRDRNVGIDEDVDIVETTKELRNCLMTDNEGNLNCTEDERKNLANQLYGDYYYWGNNIGVKFKDLVIDNEFLVDTSTFPDGFNNGKIGEENTGWGKGETNNPCRESSGEYLPSPQDWLNVMKMYGNINGNGIFYAEDSSIGIKQYIYDGENADKTMKNLINDLMLYTAGGLFSDGNEVILEPASYINFVRGGMDENRYIGIMSLEETLTLESANGPYAPSMNLAALPVRCFVYPQNESNNLEESNQQPSYSGGGGRVISTNSINKVTEPSGKEHNSASNNEELKEKITQQKSSQTKSSQSKLSTEGLLGRYYNNITKEDNEAYVRARDNNITTLPPEESNPNGYLKRGEMAKMVVNFALNVIGKKLPEKYPQCVWKDDVKDWDSKELKNYATKACALGLMGINTEYFNPKQEVTRAQFGTILSRMLWGNAFNIKDTKNKPYYTDHLKALKANGIMDIISNPDKTKEVRKRVWIMMKRTVKNK